ncbi:hypothetical protein PHYSODRAFT_322531 [Phytophthora sojae]|uniref:Uncharacterized protein n=1 Tax=Phytophthora sojae (strain P6497) TaxID=1094619 RepID=G4YMP1_PHYSP|nr:hypothetical protein PHYSODRAFT_322531 [Phytophthora sojae]EGZ28916.1 hypothetical protein PHYSODRAFT_322531 [Phytophthora sojae]|eukprot:XP_009516191.1 hypothetical protein PHYSODRAFT_322531 [Phytophthora sojae]
MLLGMLAQQQQLIREQQQDMASLKTNMKAILDALTDRLEECRIAENVDARDRKQVCTEIREKREAQAAGEMLIVAGPENTVNKEVDGLTATGHRQEAVLTRSELPNPATHIRTFELTWELLTATSELELETDHNQFVLLDEQSDFHVSNLPKYS